MVAWFIIAIATLAVFAFIAVNGVQTVATTSDAAGRVETVRRLDAAVNALLTRAVDVQSNGTVFLPVGADNPSGQGYGLPLDLATMSVTPFGQRFVYCPFGNTAGTGTTITIPQASAASYDVATQSVNGRAYVVAGRPGFAGLAQNPNVMAFVLAPRTKLSPTPNCSDVVYDTATRKFGAQNAIVRVVTRDAGVDEARTISSRSVTYFVSQAGTGSGASEGDPASLSTALAFFRSNLPSSMTIKLADGNYVMEPGDLNVAETPGRQANLVIQHKNLTPNMAQIDMNGVGQISIPGNLTLEAVILDTDATLVVQPGRTLSVKNASTGRISNDGLVLFSGQNAVSYNLADWVITNASGSEIRFGNGSLTRINAASDYGIFVAGGARLSANAATLQLSRTSGTLGYGLYTYPKGRMDFTGSAVQFLSPTTNAFYVFGEVSLLSTDVHFAAASNTIMNLQQGSQLSLHATRIGLTTRPLFGVVDNGAQLVAGQGSSEVFGSTCWSGSLFSDSQAGNVDGASSAVQPAVAVAALPASPTGPQIQAYADGQATNARRSVLRSVNQSVWICRPS